MKILLFCANSVLKLSAFTHTKQCSKVYFFLILAVRY